MVDKWFGPTKRRLSAISASVQTALGSAFAPVIKKVGGIAGTAFGILGRSASNIKQQAVALKNTIQGKVSGGVGCDKLHGQEDKNWNESSLYEEDRIEQDNPLYKGGRNLYAMDWKENTAREGSRYPQGIEWMGKPLSEDVQAEADQRFEAEAQNVESMDWKENAAFEGAPSPAGKDWGDNPLFEGGATS